MKILLKIVDEFFKKMDSLWSFEMMTLCLSHIKMKNVDSKKKSY
jgi:ribosome-associated toxin RatA of RatAB toxin-antitoxin module